MTDKYYIYFNNWWPGFLNGQDKNNIEFFKQLFNHTKLKNYEITNNLDLANVLFEAGKPNDNILKSKKWKYTIIFTGEPVLPIYDYHNMVINSLTKENYDNYEESIKKNIDTHNIGYIINDDEKILLDKHKFKEEKHLNLPTSIWYIIGNNYFSKLLNKSPIKIIPPNFCCFIVSNSKCHIRNKMFHELNKYKKVNSGGSYCNNIGRSVPGGWMSQNHLQFISQHKFMICFENSLFNHMTEKPVNAYLSNTIPIYWSSNFIKNIFNPNSMLFLENITDEGYKKLIEKVIEIDSDDNKYLKMANEPIFTEENINFWNENYSFGSLGKKINKILL